MRSDMIIPAYTWNHIRRAHSPSSFDRAAAAAAASIIICALCSVCSFLSIHIIFISFCHITLMLNALINSMRFCFCFCFFSISFFVSFRFFFFSVSSFFSLSHFLIIPIKDAIDTQLNRHAPTITFSIDSSRYIQMNRHWFAIQLLCRHLKYSEEIWRRWKKNKHKRPHRQERKNYLSMWESVFFSSSAQCNCIHWAEC